MRVSAVTEVVAVKISELEQFDTIITGSVLGPISAVEKLKVKGVSEADHGKYALTIFNLGTVFVHGSTIVEIIPARGSSFSDDDGAPDE